MLNLAPDVLESILLHKIDTSNAEELCFIKDKGKRSVLANLISDRRLSMRMTRKFSRDLDGIDTNCFQPVTRKSEYMDQVRLAERSFDKSIAAIRIAMNSLSEVINSVEDGWIGRRRLAYFLFT